RFGQEVQRAAGGQVLLACRAGGQQLRALAAEVTLEHRDQLQRSRGEDLLETVSGRAKDFNAVTSRHLMLLFAAPEYGVDASPLPRRRSKPAAPTYPSVTRAQAPAPRCLLE